MDLKEVLFITMNWIDSAKQLVATEHFHDLDGHRPLTWLKIPPSL